MIKTFTVQGLEYHRKNEHGKGQVVCYECANPQISSTEEDDIVQVVTPQTMQHVEIKRGWLTRIFLHSMMDVDIPEDQEIIWREDVGAIQTHGGVGQNHFLVELSKDFVIALNRYDALVFQKNQQYKDAWQQDGPVTALCDLKDKLYRLDSAAESGAVLKWDKDKLIGTLFDILVRDLMCLAWFGLNFTDDDDDRSSS